MINCASWAPKGRYADQLFENWSQKLIETDVHLEDCYLKEKLVSGNLPWVQLAWPSFAEVWYFWRLQSYVPELKLFWKNKFSASSGFKYGPNPTNIVVFARTYTLFENILPEVLWTVLYEGLSCCIRLVHILGHLLLIPVTF